MDKRKRSAAAGRFFLIWSSFLNHILFVISITRTPRESPCASCGSVNELSFSSTTVSHQTEHVSSALRAFITRAVNPRTLVRGARHLYDFIESFDRNFLSGFCFCYHFNHFLWRIYHFITVNGNFVCTGHKNQAIDPHSHPVRF